MKAIPIAILTAVVALAPSDGKKKHNFVPDDGYVPNKEVAIKIAVAVRGPIYGEDHISGEKPYRVNLVQGNWVVEGSLP